MSCTSCEARISEEATSQVFRILPRSGMTAWNSRSRACFALPPAESPSTRNSSARVTSPPLQSASLPGSAGPVVTFFRATFFAAAVRCCALRIASSAMRSPSAVCWFSQSEKASRATPEMNAAACREDRRSFVCPENCGSRSFAEST